MAGFVGMGLRIRLLALLLPALLPALGIILLVGIPAAAMYAETAEIERVFRRNPVLTALAGTLALLAAWFGTDVFVLRRIDALVRAARRLGQGDLGARTGVTHGRSEIGVLAQSFDQMAETLQAKSASAARSFAEVA